MQEFLFEHVFRIWAAGGWTMIPLCLLSLLVYSSICRIFIYFSRMDFHRIAPGRWQRWVLAPEEGRGEVGEIIRYTQSGAGSVEEIRSRFLEVSASRLPWIDRNLSFAGILVAAAPLLGLLGTVTGMLLTFQSIGSSGEEMAGLLAKGISAALFPPEVGLCIALPALMLVQVLRRKRDDYRNFLASLESRTVQQCRNPRQPPPMGAASAASEAEDAFGDLALSPVAG